MIPGETASSSSNRRRRIPAASRLLAAALGAALLLCGWTLAPPAGAASTKRILALLNAQRAANGIPAGIVENPAWTAACNQHNAYEKRNNVFGQAEQEGKPGYSAQGNLIAQTSVLVQGSSWKKADPYNNAPYHLFDLLNPRISSTGAADSEGFGCVEIELGTLRAPPGAPVGYSFPGNRARNIPTSQRAVEQPMSPAQTLGLGSRPTGPNLFVYFDGPWTNGARTQLSSAKLSSPRGSVALRWLDNTTSDLLAPTGAILVPAAPLRPHTTYHVSVTGSVTGVLPGTSMEQALSGCSEGAGGVECGQPASTTCVENFATQLAACGLSQNWAVREDFSFTTSRARR